MPGPGRLIIGFLLLAGFTPAAAAEWSGSLSSEYRFFFEDPLDPRQTEDNWSVAGEMLFYHRWDNGDQSFAFTPFFRIDEYDPQRSHADIRELTWLKVSDNWELRLGIRKLFWGVTESVHLVDIINQTDLVEQPDGEEKLGQPMLNLALIHDWGTLDLFVLPYFRERTFPGVRGRLRTVPRVDTDQAQYQSADEEQHVDYAARWFATLGAWDVGLSHFTGTSRDPDLLPGQDSNGNPVLIPFYPLIQQTGLDVQATLGNWLWKLETIHRRGQGDAYTAAAGGLEYTFYGVFDTAADIGLVLEYLYDDRGNAATSPFQDDFTIGLRFTLNDEQSSEALLGVILDNDSDAVLYSLEASRRLGARWKLNLEARIFSDLPASDPLYAYRQDDFMALELVYYF